jgi:hypothetical protein
MLNRSRARNFVAASPRNFAGRNVISWRRHEIRSAPSPLLYEFPMILAVTGETQRIGPRGAAPS